MDANIVVLFCVGCLIIGIFIGYFVDQLLITGHIVGSIRVDRSIPGEPPYLFLELEQIDADRLCEKPIRVFKIKEENFLPPQE